MFPYSWFDRLRNENRINATTGTLIPIQHSTDSSTCGVEPSSWHYGRLKRTNTAGQTFTQKGTWVRKQLNLLPKHGMFLRGVRKKTCFSQVKMFAQEINKCAVCEQTDV